jgi:hypothetical protein
MESQASLASGIAAVHATLAKVEHETAGLAPIGQALAGQVPERAEGDGMRAFTRRLQRHKSLIDVVLRPARDASQREDVTRKEMIYQRAADLSKFDLDELPFPKLPFPRGRRKTYDFREKRRKPLSASGC